MFIDMIAELLDSFSLLGSISVLMAVFGWHMLRHAGPDFSLLSGQSSTRSTSEAKPVSSAAHQLEKQLAVSRVRHKESPEDDADQQHSLTVQFTMNRQGECIWINRLQTARSLFPVRLSFY
ncbi:hypothetical protein DNH61_12595 [Paenibacillus sambharensis]|uniref:Uncharacterized protein n=1 Tax=Paenibacillus sambharensis TaxID=1803190 RepID=A0A2W1LLI8_9BACL|nr:hypothetical protein DNH61_12595 [Paenibacillus sambharensis]